MFTLGVVPYLNALPLYHTLGERVPIVRAVPSQLAPMLARGECDVALIPVVEHLRGVGQEIISDACVGATGSVRSVLMFHHVPIQEIQSVAADLSSRTSVALLHVLLRDSFGINPPFIEARPDLPSMLASHNAALLIGDPALEAAQNPPAGVQVLDLGAAWTQLTDLPFIFAAWVTRRDLPPAMREEIAALLSQTRDDGVKIVPQIVRDNPLGSPLSPQIVQSYLSGAIQYRITPQHQMGLNEFKNRCRKLGLTS